MPGMGELLIILLIVLLIFGATKLPQIGDSLGRSIRNFKRATNGEDEIEVSKKSAIDSAKSKELADPLDVDDAELVRSARKAKKEV
jgi:sec-independent protein translocase protein TatA